MALGEKATDSFDREFTLMINNPVPSPAGGIMNIWTKGARFNGALSILQSTEAIIAQAQTGLEVGTLAVNNSIKLMINNYFYDGKNEKYYRINSNGQESSSALTFNQTQYNVVWVKSLPT